MTSFKDKMAELKKKRDPKEAARILRELPEMEDTEVTAIFIRRSKKKRAKKKG